MKLYTSMFGNRHCLFNDSYRFGLDVDNDAERLYIAVYNKEDTKLIEREAYYTFGQIQSALKKKMKNLFYVSAQVRQNGNTE